MNNDTKTGLNKVTQKNTFHSNLLLWNSKQNINNNMLSKSKWNGRAYEETAEKSGGKKNIEWMSNAYRNINNLVSEWMKKRRGEFCKIKNKLFKLILLWLKNLNNDSSVLFSWLVNLNHIIYFVFYSIFEHLWHVALICHLQ